MSSTLRQQRFYSLWNLISLSEKLISTELSNNSSQNFITNSRQYLLLIILSQIIMNNIQFINLRMEQNSHRNPNRLHISIRSLTLDLPLSGLNIINNRILNNRDLKIIPFSIPMRWQSCKFIKFDSVVTDINYKILVNILP